MILTAIVKDGILSGSFALVVMEEVMSIQFADVCMLSLR
jgi:hypothetical protein